MSDTTAPTVPGIEMLTEPDRNYVLNVTEDNLRAELAKNVRLRRIAEGQSEAAETELDRVLAAQTG
jgi:hypothetical protein